MTAIIQTVQTPDGPFTILADRDGRVLASGWTHEHDAIRARLRTPPTDVVDGVTLAAEAVREYYYANDLSAINEIEVAQTGTPLQLTGWAELRRIEPGSPLTYTEFAERIGRPNAVRFAASLCAKNAPALFVPCHRVLRADGSLGGFAWGLEVKQSLLEREAAARAD